MPALARWCFRHRRLVLTLWLVAAIAFLAARLAYSSQFQLPGTDSARALSILKASFPPGATAAPSIASPAENSDRAAASGHKHEITKDRG